MKHSSIKLLFICTILTGALSGPVFSNEDSDLFYEKMKTGNDFLWNKQDYAKALKEYEDALMIVDKSKTINPKNIADLKMNVQIKKFNCKVQQEEPSSLIDDLSKRLDTGKYWSSTFFDGYYSLARASINITKNPEQGKLFLAKAFAIEGLTIAQKKQLDTLKGKI